MTDIATHIRIFEASPTDDFVEKRSEAVHALVEAYKQSTSWASILGLAGDIAQAISPRGKLSERLATLAHGSLKNVSPSYVLEGHELEAKVCTLIAVVQYLESAKESISRVITVHQALAIALWSALSFQKPMAETRLERLRYELLSVARHIGARSAEEGRQRAAVADAALSVSPAEGLPGLEKQWKEGPLKTINALRFNAALDREEIDVLWWVLADWSVDFKQRFSTMPDIIAPIAASLELVKSLKRMPADAHKHIVLRLAKLGISKTLPDLLEELGEGRRVLADGLADKPLVYECPYVFPLLSAVRDPKQNLPGTKEIRDLGAWSERTLLEAGLLRVAYIAEPIS
jgi:GTPase-associated system helical domain